VGAREESSAETAPVLPPLEPGLGQRGELREIAFGQVSVRRARRPVEHAVDKPVDKRCFLGRTAHVLWMNCGWPKNLEMKDCNLLCGPHRRRRNALTTGDGYRPGGDLGDVGRAGKPALAAGIQDPVAGQGVPGGRAIGARELPGRARPLHLIHGGASSYFARRASCRQAPTRGGPRRAGPVSPGEMPSPSQIPGDPVAYTDPAIRLLTPSSGLCRQVTQPASDTAGWHRRWLAPLAASAVSQRGA
jgi:hypothetical protein